jgi:hypothetical protein
MIVFVQARKWNICILFLASALVLAGCAAKKPALWGDPQTGLVLTYRMPLTQPLHYTFSTDQTQTVEVMGQAVDTESHQTIGFSVQAKGRKDGNQELGVTIESMKVEAKSPQGSFSPDMKAIIGKGFDMTISELGKELDVSGAASIQYEMGPAGKRNISSSFQAMFPDLPGRPVKVGDTWTSEDLITDKSESVEMRIRFKNEHKLDGFETVGGLECARIKTSVAGTLEGEGEQQGMGLTFKGDIKGTDTWYFAYKEGFYAGMTSSASVDGMVDTSGPQSLTIPLKQKIDMETRLVR